MLTGAGGSDSVTSRSHRKKTYTNPVSTEIDTLPLFSLLTYLGVEFDANSNVFIKVDVEGTFIRIMLFPFSAE